MKPREVLRNSIKVIATDNRNTKDWLKQLHRAVAFNRETPEQPACQTSHRREYKLWLEHLQLKTTLMCMAVAHSRRKIHARSLYKTSYAGWFEAEIDTLDMQARMINRFLRGLGTQKLFTEDELAAIQAIVGEEEVKDAA